MAFIHCIKCEAACSDGMDYCPVCRHPLNAKAELKKTAPIKEPAKIINNGYNDELYGTLMTVIPIISILLIIFWIGSMALIDRPQSKLAMIVIGTIALTAIFAMIESSKLRMGANNGTNQVAWFFCFILFWIVAYPYYLRKRSEYGLHNYCFIGAFIAIIFAGSSAIMSMAIDDAQTKLMEALNF